MVEIEVKTVNVGEVLTTKNILFDGEIVGEIFNYDKEDWVQLHISPKTGWELYHSDIQMYEETNPISGTVGTRLDGNIYLRKIKKEVEE